MKNTIVDCRVYTMRAGGMEEFLRLAKSRVLPVQLRHIGAALAYYKTEIGPQREVMHLWGYDSLADMESRRESRNADPEWAHYLRESAGLIEHQETSILRRAPLDIGPAASAHPDLSVAEIRLTTVKRGHMGELLSAYEKSALPALKELGIAIDGYYTSEVGSLNKFLQITVHKDYSSLERFHQQLAVSPRWQDFQNQAGGLIFTETLKIARKIKIA